MNFASNFSKKEKNTVILGSGGMLGSMLSNNVSGSIGLSKSDFSCDDDIDSMLSYYCPEYVVNCIGSIPQKRPDKKTLFNVNTKFSIKLAEKCHERGIKLIHPSTDCVFSGISGPYSENSYHDSDTDYGISKSLGESHDKSMVIRVSIIGPERGTGVSLLNWAKSMNGKIINGYANHMWNGITTFEYSSIINKIISCGMFEVGNFHIAPDYSYSKYEMLCMFSEVFGFTYTLNKSFDGDTIINKTLTTVKDLTKNLHLNDFKTQLINMKGMV